MPFKKTKNSFIKYFFILTLLIFSYGAYSFLDLPIFKLEKEQSQVNVLSANTTDLNLNFQYKDSGYPDFYPKEVRQPTTETLVANTTHSVLKNPKNSTLVPEKTEVTNKVLTLYINRTNGNFSFSNFDNLAGFLIQKQLKTNT